MAIVDIGRLAVLVHDPEVLGGGQQEVYGNAGQEELAITQDNVRGAHLIDAGGVQGQCE